MLLERERDLFLGPIDNRQDRFKQMGDPQRGSTCR